MKIKHKAQVNMLIDMLLFVLMLAIAGLGFMMKYVLLPGNERNDIYGSAVDLLYCGLDRHQLGDIHLVLSYVFLFFLLLHIMLHWTMIKHLFVTMFKSKVLRLAMLACFLFVTVGFGVMPFFIHPEICTSTVHHAHNNQQHQDLKNNNTAVVARKDDDIKATAENARHKNVEKAHDTPHHVSDINGQMTLKAVATHTGIPLGELCDYLDIEANDADQRLGRLRKRYSFSLEDLRSYVESKK